MIKNAKLNADSNYHESTNTAEFEVIKINDYIFEVIASDTTVGDNSVLNIILPHDAQGNLTINGKIYAINKTITLNNLHLIPLLKQDWQLHKQLQPSSHH